MPEYSKRVFLTRMLLQDAFYHLFFKCALKGKKTALISETWFLGCCSDQGSMRSVIHMEGGGSSQQLQKMMEPQSLH